jgi:hypothetical protein
VRDVAAMPPIAPTISGKGHGNDRFEASASYGRFWPHSA